MRGENSNSFIKKPEVSASVLLGFRDFGQNHGLRFQQGEALQKPAEFRSGRGEDLREGGAR